MGRSIVLKTGVYTVVPGLRGLEIPRSSKCHGTRRCPHIILGKEHTRHQAGDLTGLRRVLDVHNFPLCGANRADREHIRYSKDRFPLAPFAVHRVDKLITALSLISDLKGFLFSKGRVDKEAYGASGFEHGTVAAVLWQKWALGLAARSQTNPGSVRVRKEPYFHLRSIAPSRARFRNISRYMKLPIGVNGPRLAGSSAHSRLYTHVDCSSALHECFLLYSTPCDSLSVRQL